MGARNYSLEITSLQAIIFPNSSQLWVKISQLSHFYRVSLVDLWVLLINNFEKVHLMNSDPIIRPLQHLRCHKEIHYRCCRGLDTPLKLLTTKNLKMTKSYYFKIMSTTKRTRKATFRGQFSAGYFPGAWGWGRWAFFSDTLIKNVSEYFSKKIHGSSCGNQLLKVLKFQVYFHVVINY